MAKDKDETKADKRTAHVHAAPVQAAEGNCLACGRWARLRPGGSNECCDTERCQASQIRDARMMALDAENAALAARVADLEAALKAAQKA